MNRKRPFHERRAALLAQCGQQRESLRLEFDEVMAPVHQVRGLRQRIGGFTVPLAVLGVVIGLAIARPKKIVPTLTAAAGLWKLGRSLLEQFIEARSKPGG